MITQELLYRLTLTQLPGIGPVSARNLIRAAGNATTLFEHRNRLADIIPGAPAALRKILDCADTLRLCEAEIRFAEKNQIECLCEADEDYPSRLRECEDAPLVLFYRGTSNLNKEHIINLVGTRNATDYGKGICTRFVRDLKELLPDVIIVSGLAYGIDIHAHRSALQNGLETIGVLAHGLDRIYPAVHRKTATEMLGHGGLLTEFMSGTNPDRQNFIKRNRIVAGISDATIVVESAEKGGSLITADIAESYHRDCFAFPGRTDDLYSRGCNNLIRTNRAVLLQSAEELVAAMNWNTRPTTPHIVQRELFPELDDKEKCIVSILQKHPEGIQVNTLVVESNVAINHLTGILFGLEMKGIVKTLAGGMYKLV